jgi:TonB-linked SusC/RagA family outer membrane protein
MHSTAIGPRKNSGPLTKKLLLVMKMTAFLLLLGFLQVSARTTAQVTLREKSASLEDVLAKIKRQSDYGISYDLTLIQTKSKPVFVDVSNVAVERALEEVFKGQDQLSYSINGKVISVKAKEVEKKSAGFLSPDISILAPVPPERTDVTVYVVSAENNQVLEGASIFIKGQNKGVTTDVNGRAVLKNIDLNAIVVIGFTGYTTQEIKIDRRNSITVKLIISSSELQEVVINKGYYTEKQRNTVGNAVHVDSKDIEKQPVVNPLLALQGRVPGLVVTQATGLNGGGVTIRIQGQNSIQNGSEPLIVIDGVPYSTQFYGSTFGYQDIVLGGSPLNYINPSDIESIDILKDADATALYGSRAANGALLITTRKGKPGRSKVSLNLQQGWGTVAHKIDMLNTRQYLDMRYEAFRNSNIVLGTQAPNGSNWDLTTWDTTRYTDWQKELIGGTAKFTNLNASISGGSANIQYILGATYNRQTTVFPGTFANNSGTIHFSVNSSSSNQKFRIQFTANYQINNNGLPGIDMTDRAVTLEPDAPAIYKANGSLNWAQDASGISSWQNPMAFITGTDFTNATKNLIASANLSYAPIKNLVFSSRFGYSDQRTDVLFLSRLEQYAPEVRQNYTRVTRQVNTSTSNWIIEPQVQYSGKLGKGDIDISLNTSMSQTNAGMVGILGSGFSNDLLMKSIVAAPSVNVIAAVTSENKYFSGIVGHIGYRWKEKYLISINARRDGSSKFGPEAKFHNFGSLGLGWIFSEEEWVKKNIPVISFGKLRSTYGITGSDQIPEFDYLSNYTLYPQTISYQNNTAFTVNNIPNPNLQWEETRKWSWGMDLGLFHDRVSIGATYALNRSDNQLTSYTLPTVTGFTSIEKNLPATVENTSWEFTLNTINIKTKEFSWSSGLNLTIPRNRISSFPGIENTPYATGVNGIVIGQPIGILKVYRFAGVSTGNGNYLSIDPNGNTAVGAALNGNNVLINTSTKFYGGINNSITYKGFQLDFLMQIVSKNGARDMYFYNNNLYPGNFDPSRSNQPVSVLDRWRKPGDNATIARFSTTQLDLTLAQISDKTFIDASYARLKNLSLSWQVPGKWARKAAIQSAQIYLHAQNLFTITQYKGLDPETMSVSTLPPLRMITAGLKIEF